MRLFVFLLLLVSGYMVLTAVYEERLRDAQVRERVVYRYVPRSASDEAYYGTPASAAFHGMFSSDSAWMAARTPEEEGRGAPPLEFAFGGAVDGGAESGGESDGE